MKITGIEIIDPEAGLPVSIETWKNTTDPTAAEWVLVKTDELEPFVVKKNYLNIGGRTFFSWKEAVDSGMAPTLAQAFAIYNAFNQGLDKAIRVIGGKIPDGLLWTSEEYLGSYCPTYAWCLRIDVGAISSCAKTCAYRVQPVTLLKNLHSTPREGAYADEKRD